MLIIKATKRFEKDLELAKRRGYNVRILKDTINLLAAEEPLPNRYHDHALKGNYAGFRECHLAPDWLLVYRTDAETVTLLLFRTGTHADLF